MFARYINLDSRPDRRAHIEKSEAAKALDIQRFSALHGSLGVLSTRALAEWYLLRKHNHEIRTLGAIGCSLSHISLWKEFLASSYETCLILEDDCDMTSLMDAVESVQPIHDIAILGWAGNRNDIISHKTLQPWPKSRGFWGSHAYMLTRHAAELLVFHALPITMQVDSYIQLIASLYTWKVQVPSNPVKQRWSRSDVFSLCLFCDTKLFLVVFIGAISLCSIFLLYVTQQR